MSSRYHYHYYRIQQVAKLFKQYDSGGLQRLKKDQPVGADPFAEIGWGTWIRTKSDGVRVRCLTIWRYPNLWTYIVTNQTVGVKVFFNLLLPHNPLR